jgi:hypothetical protein
MFYMSFLLISFPAEPVTYACNVLGKKHQIVICKTALSSKTSAHTINVANQGITMITNEQGHHIVVELNPPTLPHAELATSVIGVG